MHKQVSFVCVTPGTQDSLPFHTCNIPTGKLVRFWKERRILTAHSIYKTFISKFCSFVMPPEDRILFHSMSEMCQLNSQNNPQKDEVSELKTKMISKLKTRMGMLEKGLEQKSNDVDVMEARIKALKIDLKTAKDEKNVS